MTPNTVYPLEGGCDCGLIRYRMESAPLIVHCCHCRWCQRETGTAFALNALIESERVLHLQSEPQVIDTPSQSGRGQKIARCPSCRVAVWSHYAGAGPLIRFVRVGTLDTPDALRPDIHIFTVSRQPWVILPEGVPAVPEFYEIERYWSPESLARREIFLPRLQAYRASQAG
ncbi:MAG TPA: GFA family protein [Steroidobacteraceae bacterium]|nr:GFA family protein [Steroidobacteraceae bacterium]